MEDTDTPIPRLFEQYCSALTEGDLPAAVEYAVQIDDTESRIDSLLSDFTTAVENDRRVLARTILGQIADAYERNAADFQARTQRAMAAVEEGSLTESEREELLAFARNAAQTDLTRSGFLVDAVNFFEGTQGGSNLVETASQVRRTERDIDEASETVSSVTSEASLTATPSILGSTAPEELTRGATVEVVATVGNVGDAESATLAVTVEAEDGLEPSRSSVEVGRLAGGDRTEVTVELTARRAGSHSATLALEADGSVVETVNKTFEVSERAQSVREAIAGDDSGELDATDIRTAITHWSNDAQVPGTGGKTVDTETLQRLVTEWVAANGGDTDA
ncbi:CARDB domain-containing protein [Halobaculum gomorrense]|uniref:CARDB protein n=1 Tax=Halobaculum gomorrense TaxID=43928 RepID=A0A1M5NWD0_9EURY|nr:CARDB domain-containing protein [Halobaculum gomorrense]SHG93886.1 CARDB protein [Halobaculum gomorrense]